MLILFLLSLFAFPLSFLNYRRQRIHQTMLGYEERIHALQERVNSCEGDAKLACQNQLRFLMHGYEEYCKTKGRKRRLLANK